MARNKNKIQRYANYLQVMDGGYIYFGDGKDANFYADGTGFTINGDLTLAGDITLSTEDLNLIDGGSLEFGTGKDVDIQWVNATSILQISPAVDDTGTINIGDGTKDIDLKWFGGTSGIYATFNVGDTQFALVGVDMATDSPIVITNATATSSTSTGALIVTGGIATAADIFCGDDLFFASTGVINFAAGNVTITHATGGLTCNGALTLSIATASTSTTTGGLIVTGGVGVAGKAFIGGGSTMASPDAAAGIGILTTNLYGLDVYSELKAADAALALGEVAGSIKGRLRVTKAQTNATLFGTSGHLRVVGVDTGSGVHTGLYGYYESSGTSSLASGSKNGGLQIDLESASGLTVAGGAFLYGMNITSNINNSATITGDLDAIRIEKTTSCKVFTVGIQIEDGAATTGIAIGTTTTGLTIATCTTGMTVAATGTAATFTSTTLNATTGRIAKFDGTVLTPNFGDGYGAIECNLNIGTGAVAGRVAAASTWINLAAGTTYVGSDNIAPLDVGIWGASGMAMTGSKLIMGLNMSCVIDDGANPGSLFLFSTNISANATTALFDINTIVDFSATATAASSGAYKLPFLKERSTGTTWYMNIYTS